VLELTVIGLDRVIPHAVRRDANADKISSTKAIG
jgi:hypothetical protein